MKAVEKIDLQIKELREVRKKVVAGERTFSKEREMDKATDFMATLTEYNIPFETFTFGSRLFVKIKDEEESNVDNNIEVLEDSITE